VGADLHNPPAAMWKAVPHVSHALTKPVIAATQGWVIGGGICLVMTCDLMVSADTTKFMYPEAKVGVFGGLMPGIVSRMPHKVAMELLLLGEEISVKRAYDVGFVNKVVPLGQERAEARRMAKVIAESAPLVIRTLRDFANQTLPRGPAEVFVPERYKLETIANSEDRKEGAAAFREKRTPRFKGR
jgi:enoyl-CoA hydratase/carnithine racemase